MLFDRRSLITIHLRCRRAPGIRACGSSESRPSSRAPVRPLTSTRQTDPRLPRFREPPFIEARGGPTVGRGRRTVCGSLESRPAPRGFEGHRCRTSYTGRRGSRRAPAFIEGSVSISRRRRYSPLALSREPPFIQGPPGDAPAGQGARRGGLLGSPFSSPAPADHGADSQGVVPAAPSEASLHRGFSGQIAMLVLPPPATATSGAPHRGSGTSRGGPRRR